ncbi:MAG: hypothetical protein Q8L27_00740 [archaeon]|nr:hypothetical protein [archaeon]
MKNLKQNKKAMMSIAIVILVVSTLVLVISALFIFNAKQATIDNEIAISSSLDDVYIKSEILNFYLDDICSKVQSTVGASLEFMTELEKYKTSEGVYIYSELEQVAKQVNEENVNYNVQEGLLEVKFDILLSQNFEIKDKSESLLTQTVYNYTYVCSRKL